MTCPECGQGYQGKRCDCGYSRSGSSKKTSRHSGPGPICRYETHGQRCPLRGHRSDALACDCREKKRECGHWFCAWHYVRMKQTWNPDEEHAAFLAWCQESRRWSLCVSDPALLWKILCGVVPIHEAPKGSWLDPEDERGVRPASATDAVQLTALEAVKQLSKDTEIESVL
jgi:hypothetical protein